MSYDVVHIALAAHRGADEADLTEEDVAEIDGRVEAGGRAAGHDAAAAGAGEDDLGEDGLADVLEDDVGAALVGELLDAFDQVLAGGVDGLVGAEGAHLLQLGV